VTASILLQDHKIVTEMPKGGHFAALEQPDLLLDDIRKFFATVDQKQPEIAP